MKHLEYKGYTGTIEYSKEDKLLYGKVIGTSTMRTNNGTKGASSSKSYLALVKEKKTSKTIRLQINEAEYKKLKKGDIYSECFYKGGFGVLFKWRFTTLTNC